MTSGTSATANRGRAHRLVENPRTNAFCNNLRLSTIFVTVDLRVALTLQLQQAAHDRSPAYVSDVGSVAYVVEPIGVSWYDGLDSNAESRLRSTASTVA
jgi:hypothetical protein